MLTLQKTIQELYNEVTKAWSDYSKKLTAQEDKILSIIGDKFSSIFNNNERKSKDNFLIGIETIDYKKNEQIAFTFEKYIKNLINNIKIFGSTSVKIKEYLQHYV